MLWLGMRAVGQQGLLIAGEIGAGTAGQRLGGGGETGGIEGIQRGQHQHETVDRFVLLGIFIRQQQLAHGAHAIARTLRRRRFSSSPDCGALAAGNARTGCPAVNFNMRRKISDALSPMCCVWLAI